MSMTIDASLMEQIKAAQALLSANADVLKAAETQRKGDLGVLGADFFTEVVENGEYRESDSSAWAGYSETGIPVTIGGVEYSVSLTVTDVKRKEARVDGKDFFSKKVRDAVKSTPTPATVVSLVKAEPTPVA